MSILYNCFVALLVVGGIVGVIVLLLAMVDPNNDPDEKHSSFILQYGEKFRAYIVLPPPPVYAAEWPENLTSCQVVFIKGPRLHDEDQRLITLGKRLRSFHAAEDAPQPERIIANVFRSEIGYPTPLRLPDRITDGVEAYTVSVKMTKSTFPPDWRPEAFIVIKVVFEGDDAGARRANHVAREKYRK